MKQLLFLTLVFLSYTVAPACAELPEELVVLDDTKLVALHQPTDEIAKSFEDKTLYIKRFSDREDPLTYQIRLPKDWLVSKKDNLKYDVVGGQIVGVMGEYISPINPLGRAKITVSSEPTLRDIPIKELFLAKNLAEGTSIRAMNPKNISEIEAEYVRQVNDDALVFRSRSFIYGPRLITVDFAVPVRRYNDLKDMQAYVINSFEFLEKPKNVLEDQRVFAFLNKRKMSYPAGLTLTSKRVFSANHITARFLNEDTSGFPNGTIRFDMYRKGSGTDIDEKIEEIKKEFSTEEQLVSGVIETRQYDMDEIFTTKNFNVYAVKERLNKFEDDKLGRIKNEFLLARLADDEYDYVVTVFTPTRKNNLTEWARNMRAFEIMMTSLQKIAPPDIFPPVDSILPEVSVDAVEQPKAPLEEGSAEQRNTVEETQPEVQAPQVLQ